MNLERLPPQNGALLIDGQHQLHADQVVGKIDRDPLRDVGGVCDESVQFPLGDAYLPTRTLFGVGLGCERLACPDQSCPCSSTRSHCTKRALRPAKSPSRPVPPLSRAGLRKTPGFPLASPVGDPSIPPANGRPAARSGGIPGAWMA